MIEKAGLRPRRARGGFTLVEIMIVAALIALLSGIAIFSINEFYNNNIRKAVIGEANQLATALSFAHDDVQFFPRLQYLNAPRSLIFVTPCTGVQSATEVLPGMDYYGFLPGGTPATFSRINAGWSGPYMGVSMTRNRSSRGSRSGMVKMRLPDVYYSLSGCTTQDKYSIVDWPADVWGNPYVLYQMKSGTDVNGFRIPVFIDRETEEGDYLNAVVSYGKNKFPGGNTETTVAQANTLMNGALYVVGDAIVPGSGVDFTLRVISSNPAIASNLKLNDPVVWQSVVDSLKVVGPNCQTGWVGMKDECSDDIIYEF
ncbi:prepilin-type N-terminal cleavage/methylation domain-containing protein [Candidatus Sumerlaeota bacterium]|nr:prepilin-type N-terminal cleavage/methylation domain-containing protein [Candidatus Sumerlaeota bacterium]